MIYTIEWLIACNINVHDILLTNKYMRTFIININDMVLYVQGMALIIEELACF